MILSTLGRAVIVATALAFMAGCRNEPATETAPPQSTTSTPAAQAEPAAPVCEPAPDRLCPADEGTSDASFDAYRRQLREAVEQKNEARLRELVDPGIRTSFGNGGGIDGFSNWAELAKVLDLGGSFRGEGPDRMFWAPYVYANWPESIDAFQYVAAVRPGVVVRSAPAAGAATLTTVDWAILELIPGSDLAWFHVKTSDGREGWVDASDAHGPVGYRAGFSKRSGQWKMEAFVAGD